MRALYLFITLSFGLLLGLESQAQAQLISCPTAAGRSLTSYTNGAPNDSIFFICGVNPTVGTTNLVVTASGGFAPYTFTWQKYNSTTNGWDLYSTQAIVLSPQTLSGVGAGGYKVSVTDAFGQFLGYDIVWVCEVDANPSVTLNNITASCNTFVNLTGSVNAGSITPYYNPPTDYSTPLIIGPGTQITACFTGTHTFNSDMTLALIGPPSCGSPIITLSPYSTSIGQGVNCNGADNFTNLCFSNQTTADFNICTAGANMTGTYGAYGVAPGTPINWSALNGCDATATGWQLRVQDCYITDAGTVTSASSLTFSGPNAAGIPTTLTYTPTNPTTTIVDGTCTQGGTFNPACCQNTFVALSLPTQTQTSFGFPATYQWTSNPPVTIGSPTGSLPVGGTVTTVATGLPQSSVQFTLSLVSPFPGAICGGTSSITKTWNYIGGASPIPNLPNSICSGASAFNLSASSPITGSNVGGVWSGTGVTGPVGGVYSFNPSGLVVGNTYNVTFTATNPCYSPVTVAVTITPPNQAAPTLSSPVANPCTLTPAFFLTSTITGGTWTGTGVSATGQFNPATSGAGQFTLTYNPPASSCSSPSTITITVVSGTSATITSASTFCAASDAVTLTSSIPGGTWSGSGITDASAGTFSPSSVGPGLYGITYNSGGSCPSTVVQYITVVSASPSNIIIPTETCTGSSPLTLIANVNGGTWSGSGVSGNQFDASGLVAGTYTITYTPATGQQCYSPSTATIDVLQSPDISITSPGDLCVSGADVLLTAATAGGTYSGTGITDANGTFSPVTAGIGDWTVTYSTTDACASTTNLVVHVVGTQSINLTVPSQVCVSGGNVDFTASISGGTWTGTGVNAGGNFNPSTPGVGGPYTMTYTLNDVCSSTATANVTVVSQPNLLITDLAGPLCASGNQVTLTANMAGGTWSGSGVNPSTGVFTPAANVVGDNVITYSVTGICAASDNTTVTVVATPTVAVTDPSPFCVNALNTNLSAQPAGGTWSGTGILDANSGSYSPSGAGVGSWNVTYTYTSGPCTVSDNTTVTVNSLPSVSAGANTAICNGASTPLQATGAVTYQWSINGGAAVGLNNSSVANPTASPTQTTTYTVLGVDANQCTNTATVTVTVNPLPNVNASADVSICVGESTTITATGASIYAWSPSSSLTGANTASATATPGSTQTYTVTGTDGNGCTATDNVVVTVIQPNVTINNNVVDTGSGLTFTVTTNCTNFAWDYGDNSPVFTTSGLSATHDFTSVPANGMYFVTTVVGSIGNCTAQDTIHVFVDFIELMYPNIVIVNSPAVHNQTLTFLNPVMFPGVTQIPTIVDFKAEIFNRWGIKVGEITDPVGSWDPKDVEPGAYFYTVSYNKRSAGTTAVPFLIEQSLEILKK